MPCVDDDMCTCFLRGSAAFPLYIGTVDPIVTYIAQSAETCFPGASCTSDTNDLTCTCGNGYAEGETPITNNFCNDIDGCLGVDCGPNAICRDVAAPGTGYTCVCPTGYTGTDVSDGATTCEDTDGCDGGVDCGDGGECTDIVAPGTGYTCSCSAGYDGDSYTNDQADCYENDGCRYFDSGDSFSCGTGAECTNLPPPQDGYTCSCTTGYEGDAVTDTRIRNHGESIMTATCNDVNGCTGVDCGTGATCADVAAPETGYTCTCETKSDVDRTY